MALLLYNTLSKVREKFKPLNLNLVKMYVCGPTVYDHPHIGNARSVVTYDILYRILMKIFGQKNVIYIRNITDVDDKIIIRAKEGKIKINELTKITTEYFHHDMDYLRCLRPNIEPKATEHIIEMIIIIQKLIDLGHAYISNNHVYFDILSANDYMALSNRTLEDMLPGFRIETAESKKHAGDFVLWKPASLDDEVDANFDSPWGRGRPGWHIECSAMSYKYLGENFDIHGGGIDLIFPHHTNEIAQSKCAFPDSSFANFWVHNGFLTVKGEKMSKSLGNFLTVKDLIKKEIKADVIRLFLISAHYRKPLDFNDKAIDDANKTINYWYRTVEGLDLDHNHPLPDNFLSALFDDINTPLAIKIMNDFAKEANAASSHSEKQFKASLLISCANFLGLMEGEAEEWFKNTNDEKAVNELINKRYNAKKEKNWELADQIRKDLMLNGIILEDKADGTTIWRKEK